MKKLHEETNQRVSAMFARQELELEALRTSSREVADRSALVDLGNRCHAAIVQAVFNADPIINFEGTEYNIDIFKGGAKIAAVPHAPAIRTFQKRRVISMPLHVSVVDGSSSSFIDLFDILDGRAQIVESADANLINTIEEIILCYREAFERVNFGDEAVGVRRGAAHRARVNADIDVALNNANISEDDSYWIIGWLAKNITSIKAEIPNTPAARRNLEIEYPILRDIPDEDITSYYGVNRGSARNRWDKSTLITISKKTPLPGSVKEFLETISLHRSAVEDNGLSSNVAALRLREYGFTLGPNDPERLKALWSDRLQDSPRDWENFMAGFTGTRHKEEPAAPVFNPEVEADVNPLNQEFPEPPEFGA
jgi:hypothetical protein